MRLVSGLNRRKQFFRSHSRVATASGAAGTLLGRSFGTRVSVASSVATSGCRGDVRKRWGNRGGYPPESVQRRSAGGTPTGRGRPVEFRGGRVGGDALGEVPRNWPPVARSCRRGPRPSRERPFQSTRECRITDLPPQTSLIHTTPLAHTDARCDSGCPGPQLVRTRCYEVDSHNWGGVFSERERTGLERSL